MLEGSCQLPYFTRGGAGGGRGAGHLEPVGMVGLDEGGGRGVLTFHKINIYSNISIFLFLCVLNECFLPGSKAIDL